MGNVGVLIAVVVGFQGVNLFLLSNKVAVVHPFMRWLGLAAAIASFWYLRRALGRADAVTLSLSAHPRRHRLWWLFPVAGVLVASSVVLFNLVVAGGLELRSFDLTALIFAALLVCYPWIPAAYALERSFATLFLALLLAILVAPVIIHAALTDSFNEEIRSPFVAALLAYPTAGILSLLGYPVAPQGANLLIETAGGDRIALVVTLACSGLYSFALFVSAYTAFILIRFRRLTRRTLSLIAFGVIATYIANIIRTVVIVAVGHHFGREALIWAHANVGWLLFTVWVVVFWSVSLRFIPADDAPARHQTHL